MKTKTKSNHRQAALKEVQLYKRLVNSHDGICTCISCGKSDLTSRMQGGHFISRRCLPTELELDNINPQCVSCNLYKNGNVLAYRDALIDRIGYDRVERLEDLRRAWEGSDEAKERLSVEDRKLLKKKSSSDYIEVRKKYAKLNKELKQR